MKNNLFKKLNTIDDTVIDIDNLTNNTNENKYIYYPPQKKVQINDNFLGSVVKSSPDNKKNDDKKDDKKDDNKKDDKKDYNKKDDVKILENNKEEIMEEKKSELKLKDMEPINDDLKYSEEDLLFNLKIISELDLNDKLSHDSKLFRINTTSYTQGLCRWWYGEDRAKTLEKLNEIVDETFEYIDKTFTNKVNLPGSSKSEESVLYENNSQIMQKFYITLIDAIKGLEILKATYSVDKSMVTGLSLLIDRIRTRTDNIKNHLIIKPKK